MPPVSAERTRAFSAPTVLPRTKFRRSPAQRPPGATLWGLSYFELILLGSLLFLNVLYLVNVSIRWHHAVTIVIVLVAGFLFLSRPFKSTPRTLVVVSALSIPIAVRTLLLRDADSILYLGAYLGMVIALVIIGAHQSRLSMVVLFLFVFLGVFPDTLISKIRGPVQHDDPDAPAATYEPTLIPTPQSSWRINIGPWGTTFHYTSDLGAGLFAVALCGLRTRRKAYILLMALSLYLLVFSGERAGLITSAAVGLVFLMNRRRRYPMWTCGVLLATVIGIYAANSFQEYLPRAEGEVLKSIIPITRGTDQDATSSRKWLWKYHLRLFSENPWQGAGLPAVRATHGAIVEGRLMRGGSESYYTELLAAFGITGISVIAIHLYLFGRTLRHPDLLKLLFGVILIVETVVNSMFGTMYIALPLFIMAYICVDLDLVRKLPQNRALRYFVAR